MSVRLQWAIKAKWPAGDTKSIKLQQDNALNCLTETDMVERQRQLQLEVAQSLVGKGVFETLEDFSIGNTDNDNDEDSIMFLYEEPHLDFDDHDEAM